MNEKRVIIDLFAGCGGLSIGFEMAGYTVALAIEIDEWAAETYKINHPNTRVIKSDITKISNLKTLLPSNFIVEGIIGGPPCQGFSLSGKRDKKDPRNSLFMEFVRFIDYFKPSFFMMENVPGILSMKTVKNESVVKLIMKEYDKVGYNVEFKVLNAAEYGVPQSRQRVIFIGIRKDLPFNNEELFPKGFLDVNQQITIDEAIMDLPQIKSGEGKEVQEYEVLPMNDYQFWARKDSKYVNNHIAMRHTQRVIERFETILQGQSLADVSKEHMQRKRGDASVTSGKTYSQNNMRPFGNKPSPTIAASFQSNFVHPHLNRNYTAREAARLQSFPDKYVFKGKRTTMSWEKNLSQYQQIGNAVPPLLAKAIAENIRKYFIEIKKGK
jgi:DNA (cytosine-5)-methyltransferase 1